MMEKVPILKRFGFSIFITCINIALLIFIYSVYQRNAKLSQNVPTVDHGKPLYGGSYIDLLEKNLVNNIITNSHLYDLPVQSESKYLLLFVSTSNDCSTCIDQELGHIVKVFGKKMENVWLISDSLNFIKINYTWDDRIFKTRKLTYSTNELREMFFY